MPGRKEPAAVAEHHDVIIVGGGPAGYTAAIYAARANLKPLLIEGFARGGQLMLTTDVENYPGFPQGVSGPDMMGSFRDQAERFGAILVSNNVTKLDLSQRPFGVWVDDREYRGQTVIIATGADAKWLGIDSETRLCGRGVSSCATCDGFFFRDKEMVVVGGGDTAMEEALFLARIGSHVKIVHRRDQFRASPIMVDRVLARDNISVRWNATVEEIVGEEKVEGVRVRDVVTDEVETLPAQAVFVAIGHRPNTGLVAGQLDLDAEGYLITDGTRTNVEGVFACGDVQDRVYRQAVTAAASGCMAAIDAERWLEANHASAATGAPAGV
jgi:thioredoxin reductase (NADPH)